MNATRQAEMREQLAEFDAAHPEVWDWFCQFTLELIVRGFKNYSAKGVFERIRWETDQADIEGRSTFKVNNNFSAFYARDFMLTYPEYDGFFRLRACPSEELPATNRPPLPPAFFDGGWRGR